MHMETQSAQASPTDDGGLAVIASTQWLDLTQRSASMATGVGAGKVCVSVCVSVCVCGMPLIGVMSHIVSGVSNISLLTTLPL